MIIKHERKLSADAFNNCTRNYDKGHNLAKATSSDTRNRGAQHASSNDIIR